MFHYLRNCLTAIRCKCYLTSICHYSMYLNGREVARISFHRLDDRFDRYNLSYNENVIHISVIDSFGIINKGYGTVILKEFEYYCLIQGFRYIVLENSVFDGLEDNDEWKSRRNHFYSKLGYNSIDGYHMVKRISM